MKQFAYTIKDKPDIHVRPANLLAKGDNTVKASHKKTSL